MRKEPAANAAGVIDELDGTSQQPAFGVDVVAPDFQRQKILLAVGRNCAGERHAETDLDRMGRARGHSAPVDDRAQNCERDAQNGASCGGKHRADLLPRHDGSDRSSPRALLVARAKVKRGRPRRDTIERWPICRLGRRKIPRRSDPKAITSHA
jgi:hypothetical protein